MATVKVEVNIEDWLEVWSDDSITEEIKSHMIIEVMKKLKQHPDYKSLIEKKVKATIEEMENA